MLALVVVVQVRFMELAGRQHRIPLVAVVSAHLRQGATQSSAEGMGLVVVVAAVSPAVAEQAQAPKRRAAVVGWPAQVLPIPRGRRRDPVQNLYLLGSLSAA